MSTNEIFGRLDAAVHALEKVDLTELSDAALEESLDQLSMALCQVDLLLSRLADATRLRGFTIVEQLPTTLELQLPTRAKTAATEAPTYLTADVLATTTSTSRDAGAERNVPAAA